MFKALSILSLLVNISTLSSQDYNIPKNPLFGKIELIENINKQNREIKIFHIDNYEKVELHLDEDTFYIDKEKLKIGDNIESYILIENQYISYLSYIYRGQDFIDMNFYEDSIENAWGHISFYYNINGKNNSDVDYLKNKSENFSELKIKEMKKNIFYIHNNSLYRNDKYSELYLDFVTEIGNHYRDVY
jgi:hypothetical protein